MTTPHSRTFHGRGLLVRRWVAALQIAFNILGLFASSLSLPTPVALAATGINNMISYQARLMDAGGFPVSNGSYSVKFSLYDAPTGGNRLWTASGSTASPTGVTVSVTAGLFTVLLGDTGQNTLNTVDWNSDSIYLGVSIESDAEMTPRRRLASAAQAFNSNQLQGQYASGTAFGGNALFTINQTSSTAATSTRTALEVRSSGTSDSNDFLFRGINDLNSPVFTLNRQGSVTTTGNLVVQGTATSSIAGNLLVTGQLVCLASGTNCAGSAASTSTFQQITNNGASTTNQLYLFNGFIGASSTVTSTFTVLGATALGTLTATNATFTNVTATTIGATTVSTTQLYVASQLVCLASGTNCPGSSETLASVSARGSFATTTLQLYGGFIGASSTVTSTLTVLGATSLGNLTASNATFSQVTTTNLFASVVTTSQLFVNGQTVCLTNGANCAGFAATTATLQQITNNGATTTNEVYLLGGSIASSSTVTGTITAAAGAFTDLFRAGGLSAGSVQESKFEFIANGSSVSNTLRITTAAPNRGLYIGSPTAADVTSFIDFRNGGVGTRYLDFRGEGVSRMVLTAGGLLGIGTTTPSTTLDVHGTISVSSTTANVDALAVTGTTKLFGNASTTGNVSVSGYVSSTVFISNAGTVTVPGFAFSGHPNTGLFDQSGQLRVAASGVLSAVFESTAIDTRSVEPLVDATYDVGVSGLRYRNALFSGTVTSTNFNAVSGVTVNNISVCLADGTNCPGSAASTSTLQQISNNGATTTNELYLLGGLIAPSSTVTSTLTVLGNTSLTTFTATSGTAATLNASNGNFGNIVFTNGTSTNWLGFVTATGTSVFATNGTFATATVMGQAICLQNGTFCPGSTETLASVSARGSFATATLQLLGGFIGASSTVTSTFTVVGATTLGTLTFTNATGNNVTTTNIFGSNGTFTNSTIANLNGTNATFTAVTSTAWLGFATASGTTLNASAVLVNGVNVCLANGTNCPTGTTPNLQTVTNAGNTTTNAIQFAGGTSTATFVELGGNLTSSSTVTGTLTVLGTTALQTLTATNATFTNVTATTLGASVVSTTQLYVASQLVCLQSGTNCPAEADTLASVSARGSFATTTLQLYGGFIGSSSTVTSTFTVIGASTLGTLTFTNGTGTNVTSTNLFSTNLTATNGSITNASFTAATSSVWLGFATASGTTLNASAVLVNGINVCLQSGTNCPGSAASTSTLQQISNNGASTTNELYFFGGFLASSSTVTSTFTVLGNTSLQGVTFGNGTGTSVTTTNLFGTNGTITNLTFTNGTSTSWFGFNTASGTLLNAAAVLVNGFNVCLANGVNCPGSAASTSTLQQISNNGASTTNELYLFGGFIASSSTVTSTFTVLGNASLQGITGTNATFTNVTSSNLFVSGVVSTSQLFVNGSTVCLTNGTNCPGSAATTATLQQISNNGATTTNELYLLGGLITPSSTVTSTFTVLGNTSLNTFTGTSGTVTTLNGGTATFASAVLNALSVSGASTLGTLTATNATFTNVTATTIGASVVSTTQLYVASQLVCLQSGTNCPGSSETLATVSARGSFATTTLQLYGGFIGASSTVTSTFTVIGGTTLGTLTFTNGTGTNVTSTNLFSTNLTATNGAITNATFTAATSSVWLGFATASGTTLNAGAVLVNGINVCLASGLNCPGTAASTSTLQQISNNGASTTNELYFFGGFLTASSTVTGTLAVVGNTTLSNVTFANGTATSVTTTNLFGTNGTITNLSFTNGTSTSWLGFNTASGTLLNASGVFVNGSPVCLLNGTNCPSGTTPNLQTVTNAGNTTTNAIQFAGGTSTATFVELGGNLTSSSTVTGTLTVLGTSALQTLTATNATFSQVTTTNLSTSVVTTTQLYVASQLVCLQSGTNCPGEADTLATVSARGSFATTTLQLYGGFIGSSSTVTSTFTVVGATTLGTLTFTNGTATSVTSTNLFSTNLTATNGTITTLTGTNATFQAVTSTVWLGFATASGTTLNASAVLVNGINACLQNGTNCPGSAATTATLQQISNNGATTTNELYLLGGLITPSSTVTSTFTVLGSTSLQSLTFTQATGTSVTTTNLFGTNGTFTNLSFTNGTSTNWLGFSIASGTTLNAGAVLVNGFNVCLANGTNCPGTAATTATLQQISNNGATTTNELYLLGGLITNTSTVTGTLTVLGNTSLNTFTGTSGTVTTLNGGTATFASAILNTLSVSGASTLGTLTATNATFSQVTTTFLGVTTASATQLLVAGQQVCLASGTNCPGSSETLASVSARGSFATTTLQLYGGFIGSSSTVTSTFTVVGGTTLGTLTFTNGTGTNVTSTNLFSTNGTFTNASFTAATSSVWLGFATASGTTLNAGAVLVNGINVCLASGTNCPGIAASTSTLQQISNNGATTTNELYFLGGFMGASSTVTSTFTVLGSTSLAGLTFTSGTGTAVTTTNLFGTNGTITNLTFTNGTSTSWLGFNTASGTLLNAGAVLVNGFNVCLANGVNCPGSAATTATLQTISNNGATTTNELYLLSGLITNSSTVTGTITAAAGAFTDLFRAGALSAGSVQESKFEFIANGSSVSNTLRVTTASPNRGLYIGSPTAADVTSFIDFRNGLVGTRYLDFRGEGVSRMVLTAAGSLGIGTTTPSSTLDVRGSIYVSSTTSGLDALIVTGTTRLLGNVTSTGNLSVAGLVSSTSLLVNSQPVCLANGVNCPGIAATTATLQQISNNGATTTNELYLLGGLITSSSTVTSTLSIGDSLTVYGTNTSTFNGPVSTSRLIIGRGSVNQSNIYCPDPLCNNSPGFYFTDNAISTNIASLHPLTIGTGGLTTFNVFPLTDNTYSLGTNGSRWLNGWFSGTVTTTNLVATNSTTTNLFASFAQLLTVTSTFLTVNGQQVCLANGVNCPSSTSNLQQVSNNGATTTNELYLLGGLIVSSSTVTGTLTVLGDTSLQGLTAVNATATTSSLTFVSSTRINLPPVAPVNLSSLTVSSTNSSVKVVGQYAYDATANEVHVIDVTNPASPRIIGTQAGFGNNISDIFVQGTYAYVNRPAFDDYEVVDVTNPALPRTVATNTVGNLDNITVDGAYLYVWVSGTGLKTYDNSDPTKPVLLSTTANISALSSSRLIARNGFVYVLGRGNGVLAVYDARDPRSVSLLGSTTIGVNANSFDVSGGYAYIASLNAGNSLNIIDVSNPAAPRNVATSTPSGSGSTNGQVRIVGDYAFYSRDANLYVINVSDPNNPVIIGNYTAAGALTSIDVKGHYGYLTLSGSTLVIIDLYGLDAVAGRISSLETDSLNVNDRVNVGGSVNLSGGLSVGLGGISSLGALAVYATDTTSTILGTVSTSRLYVNGTLVCLATGVNCPTLPSTANLQTITTNGATTTNTLTLYGGFIGASSTVTSTLTVLGTTALQTLTATNATFTQVSTTNLFATVASTTQLYVASQLVCLQNGVNCPGSSETLASVSARGSFATTTLQLYGGFIGASSTVTSTLTVIGATTLGTLTATNATFTNATATSLFANSVSSTNLTFTAGTSTLWLGFATASGTNLNASSILVNGISVCLANGVNCPGSAATTATLQTISQNGATTTRELYLLGGVITNSSTVTSSLTVLGSSPTAPAVTVKVPTPVNVFDVSTGLSVSATSTNRGVSFGRVLGLNDSSFFALSNDVTNILGVSSSLALYDHVLNSYSNILYGQGGIGNQQAIFTQNDLDAVGTTAGAAFSLDNQASNSSTAVLSLRSPAGIIVEHAGNGSPEGSVFASSGSIFFNGSCSSSGTCAYLKTGTGVTGWKGIATTDLLASGQSLQQVTNVGATTSNMLTLYGGFLSGSSTVTSTLNVLGNFNFASVTTAASFKLGIPVPLADSQTSVGLTVSSTNLANGLVLGMTNVAGLITPVIGFSQDLGVPLFSTTGTFLYNTTSTNAFTIFNQSQNGLASASFSVRDLNASTTANQAATQIINFSAISSTALLRLVNSGGSGGAVVQHVGTGSPEGSVYANSGSIYFNSTCNVSGSCIYLKTTSNNSTGWQGIATTAALSSAQSLQQVTNIGATTSNMLTLLAGLIAPTTTVTSSFTSIGSANFFPTTSTAPVTFRTAGIGADGQFVPGVSVTSTNTSAGIQLGTYGFTSAVTSVLSPAVYFSGNLNNPVPLTNATSAAIWFDTSTAGLYSIAQNAYGGGSEFAIQDLNASNTVTKAAAQIINFGNNSSTAILRLRFANSSQGGSIVQHVGSGSPEGTVYANEGSIYFNITGAASGTQAYLKSQNANSTGWLGIATTDQLNSGTAFTTATLQQISNNGASTTNLLSLYGGFVAGSSTVTSTITNIIQAGTTFSTLTTTQATANKYTDLFLVGHTLYVAEPGRSALETFDVTNPSVPSSTGYAYSGSYPEAVFVSGNYAYVPNRNTDEFNILDVSNPGVPINVATSTGYAHPQDVYVQDGFAYVTNDNANRINVVDVRNPYNPTIVATATTGLIDPNSITGYGKYIIAGNRADKSAAIFDVHDPFNPSFVATAVIGGGGSIKSVAIQGNLLYLTDSAVQKFGVVSLVNTAAPRHYPQISLPAIPLVSSMAVSGRYAYVGLSNGTIAVIDVRDPNNPTIITSITVGSEPLGLVVSGRYLYVGDSTDGNLRIIDINGIETNGLTAQSAEIGTLQVLTDATILNKLFANGGIQVGAGGISSQGALAVTATGTTSTFAGSVSTTQLYVAGQLVCLANGTNCGAAATTATLQQITNNGASTTNQVYLLGGVITNTSTVSSTFTSIGSANFYPSTSTAPVSIRTPGIAADGQFVPGLQVTSTNSSAGVQIGTYGANGTIVPTIYFSGNLNTAVPFSSATSAAFYFDTSTAGLYSYLQNPLGGGSQFNLSDLNASGSVARAAAQIINFGNTSSSAVLRLRWASSSSGGSIVQHVGAGSPEGSVYANIGSIYFNTTGGTAGTQAYLKTTNANSTGWMGIATTNQLASGASLQQVTNVGATTSNMLTLYAGFIGASSTVTSTFTVLGGTNLQAVTSTSLYTQSESTLYTGDRTMALASSSNLFAITSAPRQILVRGNTAYVLSDSSFGGSDFVATYDISNPAAPSSTGGTAVDDNTTMFDVAGDFIYTANSSLNEIEVIDLRNANHGLRRTYTLTGVKAVKVVGRFLYAQANSPDLTIYEMNNEGYLNVVGSEETGGSGVSMLDVQGSYAYIQNGISSFRIVDVANPTTPVESASVGGVLGGALSVQGNYAYIVGSLSAPSTQSLLIYNVMNPNAPYIVTSTFIGATTSKIFVEGRYVYTPTSTGRLIVVDVKDPTAPVKYTLTSQAGTETLTDVAVQGHYAYAIDGVNSKLLVYDLGGIDTNGLTAGTADVGVLSVRKGASFAQGVDIVGGLQVGRNGIYSGGGLGSLGSLAVGASNTTSTILGNLLVGTSTVIGSGLNANFALTSDDLFVSGNIGSVSSVYTNGEFVAGAGSTHYGNGYITKNDGNLTLGASGGNVLPTSDAGISLGSSSQRFNANLAFATATTMQTSQINSYNNNLLLWTLGSGTIVLDPINAGSGLLFLGDSTDIVHIDGTVASNIIPSSNNLFSLGSAALGWNANLVNATATNVTTTSLYASGSVSTTALRANSLSVGGANVCLSNGTNCPGLAATTATLQTISQNGATTTRELYLLGGEISSSSTVTSSLAVIGALSYAAQTGTSPFRITIPSTTSSGGAVETGLTLTATNTKAGFSLWRLNLGDDYTGYSIGNDVGNPITGTTTYTVFDHTAGQLFTSVGGVGNAGSILYQSNLDSLTNSSAGVAAFNLENFSSASGTAVLALTQGGGSIVQHTGSGSPESTVYANIGSIFFRQDGSAPGTQAYLKTQSANSTGWQGIATVDLLGLTVSSSPMTTLIPVGNSGNSPMDAEGNTIIRSYFGTGFNIIDVSNPSAPIVMSTTTLASAWTPLLNGRTAYVMTFGGVVNIYDIANRAAPSLLGTISGLAGSSDGLYLQGSTLYISDSASLQAVDVSNPASPRRIGALPLATGSRKYGVYVKEGTAYVTGGTVLYVVDVTDPSKMTLKKTLTGFSSLGRIDANDTTLYALDAGLGDLLTIDIRSATNPTPVATSTGLSLGASGGIAVSGQQLYVAGTNPVTVYDISNPRSPSSIGTFGTGDASNGDVRIIGGGYLAQTRTANVALYAVGNLDITALRAGAGFIGNLTVETNLSVLNNGYFGGLSVGRGGFLSSGISSFSASSTSATVSIINTSPDTVGSSWGAYIDTLLVGNSASATGTNNFAAVIRYASGTTSGGLCLDDSGTANTCPTTGINGASIFADGNVTANAFDLAERYMVSGTSTPGDVLVLDSATSATVKVSPGIPYDPHLIGVASTAPGLRLGWLDSSSSLDVALSGRVPTRVNMENGPVLIGDPLTSSHVPGYAMKAKRPGMIIGYALEDSFVTGTVEVFMNVGYSANTALNTDGSLSILGDDLVVGSTTTASALQSFSDSWGLTFRGSVWDAATSTAVNRDFTLLTDIISATSSVFAIRNASTTNLFTLDASGTVQITGDLGIMGKLYPSARGTLQTQYYIFVDNSSSTNQYISTNADGWQAQTSYDLAERYYSSTDLESGDLVMASTDGELGIQKAVSGAPIMGIVSTKPGFILGRNATSTYPIALSGRVPTKVSGENGAIHVGDLVALSSTPGVAAKAVQNGNVVGIALEDYANAEIGMIQVFVSPHWDGSFSSMSAPSGSSGSSAPVGKQGFADIAAGTKNVEVHFASLAAYPNIRVTPYGQVDGVWWVEQMTDSGFRIVMAQEQAHDVRFGWEAVPSQTGDVLYNSDGTFGAIDPTTGVGPAMGAGSSSSTDLGTGSSSGTDSGSGGIDLGGDSGGDASGTTP